jgi:hypothetical protein
MIQPDKLDLREQIQEDIFTHFSDELSQDVIDFLCKIVADNFKKNA